MGFTTGYRYPYPAAIPLRAGPIENTLFCSPAFLTGFRRITNDGGSRQRLPTSLSTNGYCGPAAGCLPVPCIRAQVNTSYGLFKKMWIIGSPYRAAHSDCAAHSEGECQYPWCNPSRDTRDNPVISSISACEHAYALQGLPG